MRKAHNIPATVKAANLAHWFPPCTVSREQWTIIMWSSVSGVAVDTLLFSRIGVPLFHRYRVFSRQGTHVAFHGTYMARIRTFLEESDAASLRSRHRRRAREIASWMSQTTLREDRCREPDSSSQLSTSRRPGSRVRKSAPAAAVAAASVNPVVVRSLHSSPWTIPALMDLALPKFANPKLLSERLRSTWIVMSEVPVRLRGPLRSPAPCLNLDTRSSDESAWSGDVSAHPICISDVSSHSGDPDQALSDDDLPPEVWVVDLPPEVHMVDLPPAERADSASPVPPPGSARMSPDSPPVVPLDQLVDSSVAISPNPWITCRIFWTWNPYLRYLWILRDF